MSTLSQRPSDIPIRPLCCCRLLNSIPIIALFAIMALWVTTAGMSQFQRISNIIFFSCDKNELSRLEMQGNELVGLDKPCLEIALRLKKHMERIEMLYGPDLIQRSQVSRGSALRESILLQKLVHGKAIKVVAIGGSVTAAIDLSGGLETGNHSYAFHIVQSLNKVFPTLSGENHTLIRSFLPGAGSFVHRFCAFELIRSMQTHGSRDWLRAKEADWFIVESSANDWVRLQPGMKPLPENETFIHVESLVRQLLQLSSNPVVSFLHFGVHNYENPQTSSFLRSGEFLMDIVASYYQIPSVSMWKAYFPLVTAILPQNVSQLTGTGNGNVVSVPFQYKDYFLDKTHPTARGHESAGSFAVYSIFSEFYDLFHRDSENAKAFLRDKKSDALPKEERGSRRRNLLWRNQEFSRVEKAKIGWFDDAWTLKRRSTFSEENVTSDGALSQPLEKNIDGSSKCSFTSLQAAGTKADTSLPKTFQFDVLSLELPHPLQSEANSEPFCALAADLEVLQNGNCAFNGGWIPINGTYLGNVSCFEWNLAPCGPLVPKARCWEAQKSKGRLSFRLNLGGRAISKLGFVYKVRHFEKWKGAGADVSISGHNTSFLPMDIQGNTLTHWWLSNMIKIREGKAVESIEFIPRTDKFDLIAIVGE